MASQCAFFLLFVLLAFGDAAFAKWGRDEEQPGRHQRRSFSDLNPQDARTELETDGGKLEVWGGRGSGVFEDANVAACRTTLRQRGLWLPSYVDAPTLHVVTRGSGRVGIVSSLGDRQTQENAFKVKRGDVVAIPEGFVVWWYNDGDRDLEIVGAADVTGSPRPAGLRAFHIAGGRQGEREERRREESEQEGFGGVLHGFSREVLARAWETDESSVRELLESQKEVGIVKVDKDIRFPEDDERAKPDNLFREQFVYRFAEAHPDVRVTNGGELRELSSYKLPVLKHLGLGMECMELEQDAMVSPNWFHNGHQLLYVVEGRGSVEVVYHNGEQALQTDLKEGSLVVIPAFHPSTKIAARDERFHYITFVTSDRPVMSYLSGRNSVYRGIPLRVLSRILNVGEERVREIQRAHEQESIIFPGQSRRSVS